MAHPRSGEAGPMMRWLPQGLSRPVFHFFAALAPQPKSTPAPERRRDGSAINPSADDMDLLRELSVGPRRVRVSTAAQVKRRDGLSRLVEAGYILASLNPSGHAQAFTITERGRAAIAATEHEAPRVAQP